ncbi:TolC family protein [Pseudochryseolinea flava]|uniref:TolC family protein n=1 Tax=Pseudochryseolinea flava TaxID=2059302 RepID=A0A364Y6B0_9BACT|nr:TolC family protein [Pseudochryseolinea flava]RAW01638.1 TolC family protein [Pseudochryseolinea flava]
MKRVYQIILLLLLITPLWTHAQTDSTSSFSLDDCIKYALENSVDVKNAKIEEQISQAKVRETTGMGLPQIDGTVNVTHNPKLPRMFMEYPGFFAQQPTPENPNPPPATPGIEDGEVFAMPNLFQLKSSGDAGINATQLLFSSTYLVGLRAAKTYKELSYKTTEQTKIQTVENVTKAYYGVLINNERVALFDNNIGRVDSLLKTTKALNQNGFAEEIDVDRIQVTLNNLKIEKLKFQNLQNLSLALLKFQMNYPMDQQLAIDGDLTAIEVNEETLNQYVSGWDFKNRIEYRLLETQRDLQKLNIKRMYSNGLPTLSAFVGAGYQTGSKNIAGLFKTESSFTETPDMGVDKWYPYTRFGLNLSIPIFSGMQRTYKIQQEKLALKKIENNFQSLQRSFDLNIQQNSITFENALESLKSQKENLTLADKVARVTKIKYEQGVGSNIEVIDAESSLRESQVNYYNALYDAIIAKVDLDKAFAKINPANYSTTDTQK